MARPKGKLFALLAVFAAIGLVAASGAFTSVSAERTVSVDVAGDSSALLQLNSTNTANGAYAQDDATGNSALQIDLDDSQPGVNPNANTTLGSVFSITNQGTQEVSISLSNDGGTNNGAVSFYVANNTQDTNFGTLAPGDSVAVGIQVDTTSDGVELGNGDSISVNLVIEANAT